MVVPLRIGLISQWYEPESGGGAIPGVLAEGLVKRGHEVRVLTGFPNYPQGRLYDGYRMSLRRRESIRGADVRRVPLLPGHGSSSVGRMLNYGSFALSAALASGHMRDVEGLWVYNSPPSVELPTSVVRRRARPRTVLHVMDLWPDSLRATGFMPDIQHSSRISGALDALVRRTYESADIVAFITPTVGRLLQERGVDKEKLAYVPLWADESVFYPADPPGTLRRELGLEGRFVLMYAGALGAPQGLDSLISACARLRDRPEFACVILGTGTAEGRLRRAASDLGCDNVHFVGSRPKSEMTDWMALGDLHLISLSRSPLTEATTPSKVQATLACGRPMLVAAAGDAVEVLRRSRAGWACAPGDVDGLELAIREAMDLGTFAMQTLGSRARKFYEDEFSVERGTARVERALGVA